MCTSWIRSRGFTTAQDDGGEYVDTDYDVDILIENGTVVDGTGGPEYRADVAIRGDEIVAISRNLNGLNAGRVIDATGKLVTPGFIDLHSHADRYMIQGDEEYIQAKPHIVQGISTIVGQQTVRGEVMGDDYERHATGAEIDEMRRLTREGVHAGQWPVLNGQFAIDGGDFQGALEGQILRRTDVQTNAERIRADR